MTVQLDPIFWPSRAHYCFGKLVKIEIERTRKTPIQKSEKKKTCENRKKLRPKRNERKGRKEG